MPRPQFAKIGGKVVCIVSPTGGATKKGRKVMEAANAKKNAKKKSARSANTPQRQQPSAVSTSLLTE